MTLVNMLPATRLYISDFLDNHQQIIAPPALAHRLRRVLRLKTGALVEVFNGRDGSWQATLALDGEQTALNIGPQIQKTQPQPSITLAFAPIKGARQAQVIDQATQLGVSILQPLITQRTIAGFTPKRYIERLKAAAEQCGRCDLPEMKDPQSLTAWQPPPSENLIVCAEWGGAVPIIDLCQKLAGKPVIFLIGPEGGFSQRERDHLDNYAGTFFAGLGSRILRADTAAIAALAAWQAVSDRQRPTPHMQGNYQGNYQGNDQGNHHGTQ